MNEKPYYSLDSYLKETYGQKIYKAALNAGLSCPNRDGTLDTRGCIFCSRGGSGDFSVPVSSPEDFGAGFEAARQKLAAKYGGSRFIAYFQAYTNTYGPVPYLEAVYRRALSDADVAGIPSPPGRTACRRTYCACSGSSGNNIRTNLSGLSWGCRPSAGRLRT